MLDPLVFSQSGHVALVAALVMLALAGRAGPFPAWLLAMSLVHHVLSYVGPATGSTACRSPSPRPCDPAGSRWRTW